MEEEPFTYRRDCWYVAGWRNEVSAQGTLSRVILGDRVVFWRDASGDLIALADRCSHRHAPLSLGVNEGDGLRCAYHGMKFDRNGRGIDVPCQAAVGPNHRVKRYAVVERDAFIWIWPGDPDAASIPDLPDLGWFFSREWVGVPATIHYRAPEPLILDNLLDLSHVAFVHATTLGGTNSASTVHPKVERLEDGVRMTNWHFNEPIPPYYKELATFGGLVDRWFIAEWTLRVNIVTIDGGSAPAGQGAAEGASVPGTLRHYNVNALTPETEDTTHYFYAFRRNFAQDDESVTRALAHSVAVAFDEDRRMIEAQAHNLGREPMQMIKSDVGLAHARKLIAGALARDRASASLLLRNVGATT